MGEGEKKQQEVRLEQEVRMQLKGKVRGEDDCGWLMPQALLTTSWATHTHTGTTKFHIFPPLQPAFVSKVLVLQ